MAHLDAAGTRLAWVASFCAFLWIGGQAAVGDAPAAGVLVLLVLGGMGLRLVRGARR